MKTHPLLGRVLVLVGVCLGLSASVAAQDCKCPKFEIVSELEVVKAGETVEFEIVSNDTTVRHREFTWTTSGGEIVSGQGTRKIVIQTTVGMLTAPPPRLIPQPVDAGGYIFSGGLGRRRAGFNVSAVVAGKDCFCKPISATIEVGRENRETNKPADVTDLTLNTDLLTLPCEPGRMPAPRVMVSPSMVIDVGVTAHDPENDILTYNYTVSGGRIVGAGANVKWDLSSVAPGSYTITAGVDDGCGLCGKTETKTVTVTECAPTCALCECANDTIAGPINDVLSAGENVFTANVTAGTYDPTYEWLVDGGEIVSGQGTPSISVKFDQRSLKANQSVTLRIGGAPQSCACFIAEQAIEYINGRRKP